MSSCGVEGSYQRRTTALKVKERLWPVSGYLSVGCDNLGLHTNL
jgi:hypothetical protein